MDDAVSVFILPRISGYPRKTFLSVTPMPRPVMTDHDDRILRTWHANVAPWTQAVRAGEIGSRVAVTNEAILATLRSLSPTSLLDLGCGEGWICHTLATEGVHTVGTDAIPGLVEAARAGHPAGGTPEEYHVCNYADIAAGALEATYRGAFNVIVCNFALFGEQSVAALLRSLPPLLANGGHLVIQTLHSVSASASAPYTDGWREGSWTGFSDAFTDPAPWYFRTIGSWVTLLHASGFQLREMREPLHPATGAPASLILVSAAK